MKIQLLVLALVLAGAGLFASPGVAGSGLAPGDHGQDVLSMQRTLQRLGYLPEVSGLYGEATEFALTAFQKEEGLARDGIAGTATLARLATAKRPLPRYFRTGTRIEVSLSKQLVYLIKDGTVQRTISISSGRPGYTTPSGSFTVTRKEPMSWSRPFRVWLPYASYFVGGIAFHAYPDVPAYPASHGCVRVPAAFAAELYAFATRGISVRVYY